MRTYTTYMCEPDAPLSEQRLNQILNTFQTTDLPILTKLGNYYDGKQKILEKLPVDEGRPNAQIIINYCKMIVDNFSGVFGTTTFMGDNIDQIQEVLDYNDITEQLSEWLRMALIYGRGFLINYIDMEGKQRLQVLDSLNCIPVYDDTIERSLQYVIRCWEDKSKGELTTDTQYKVEVYGPSDVKYYSSNPGFETFTLDRVEPHHFGQCPVTVFSLNRDELGVFKSILSIQDAVNELISGELNNFSDFADAYLVLSGLNSTDEEDLKTMKKNKCILLPGEEHCSAEFLVKNISDTQIENILNNLNTKIFTIAQCPDFSDPQLFGNASSALAIRYKLLNFLDACSNIEGQFKKAIQRMIELIVAILNLVDEEETWRDIEIVFRRNLPIDMAEILNIVNSLRGVVSNETLLGQIPFIESPEEEMEKLQKENDILELYSFNDNHNHEEVNEEEDEEDDQ